ncbi:DUF6985 domain-containing protein [Butyrivibrio sp. JL13D10]|uniref:DUF6985 domain-containing protein n=1 Tax=Butyrivibrio sp. JL13D10 TaxID=3236815 RepID=UPI0038B4FAE4
MSNKVNLNIWGRDFELNIVFQNFPGEEVTAQQNSVVDSLTSIDFSASLDSVKDYIVKYNSEDLGGTEITNIFKYVIPKSVLIPRENDKRVAALMCNYKFDMEHGMAVVYENEQYKAVGPQDIIL